MNALWTIKQAADHLGVPESALEKAAAANGLLIAVGRAKRVKPEELEELVEACRVKPKVPASTGANAPTGNQSGKSGTATSEPRPAQLTVQQLRLRSRNTSRGSTARLVPLTPQS